MPEAYEDWISIYNNDMQEKWKSEKLEIRKIAMIYCAFENEVKKLKATMSSEIKEIKAELRRKAFMQKRQNFFGIAETLDYGLNLEPNTNNKENETPEIVPVEEIQETGNKEKTPEKMPLKDTLESEEIIIESPDTCAFFDNHCSTPAPPLSELNTEAVSPVLVKKHKQRKGNPANISSSLIFNPVMIQNDKQVAKTPEGKQKEFKTPQNFDDSNILESSIIESTPEVKLVKKPKSKLSLAKHQKKKLSQCKQNTTLTQMFGDTIKKKKRKELDSNGSSMSITAMIDLINQSSGSETDDGLDKPIDNDATIDNLEAAGDALQDKHIPSNFVENYDKFPDRKEKMKNPDFHHDVVRGKERKKLKGWACPECEAYYKGLNLSPEELERKKDHCSRHRHRFQPREDTFAGFWDLTFGPSPKTQEKTSDAFNSKKK